MAENPDPGDSYINQSKAGETYLPHVDWLSLRSATTNQSAPQGDGGVGIGGLMNCDSEWKVRAGDWKEVEKEGMKEKDAIKENRRG
ncbi:hypothetical protein Pmani_032295 [Petrolisthes manimaculis]|uniref:Uncharacterized protein n=1 Tax=Petrolisthes manimaculis TaxID=1843537 RepID=A0AAE1TTY0_9EUCA|nr:hypothetical protein Pmani_032295 [Petrolisthes manimaculis]